MNNEIRQRIEECIIGGFDSIDALDSTSKEYYNTRSSIMKEINILVELLQKEDVNNGALMVKEKELDINAKRDINVKSDRIIKIISDGAAIIIPIIFYNVWMNKGFKFEEEGTYTSNTFKNLISKFKPTK